MVREGRGGIDQLLGLIEEHGPALTADFRQIYGVSFPTDVWSGAISRRDALHLVNGLAVEPKSRYRAAASGVPDALAWDESTYLLAQIHDLIRFLLPALGGAKVPAEAAWPRPAAKQDRPADAPVGRIADFDADAFLAGRW